MKMLEQAAKQNVSSNIYDVTICVWSGEEVLISVSPNYMPPVQYDIDGDVAIATWKNGNIADHVPRNINSGCWYKAKRQWSSLQH